jgi:proteasome lid subunit RPN8/RPN11
MILQVTAEQLNVVKEDIKKAYPIEACGLLFGKSSQSHMAVEKVVPTPNVLQSSVRFEIEPRVFYEALTHAEKDGLNFIGFFHSHPVSASPSIVDLKFMRLWPDALWLIFSLVENKFAAFQMKNGKVHTLSLKVEGKFKE